MFHQWELYKVTFFLLNFLFCRFRSSISRFRRALWYKVQHRTLKPFKYRSRKSAKKWRPNPVIQPRLRSLLNLLYFLIFLLLNDSVGVIKSNVRTPETSNHHSRGAVHWNVVTFELVRAFGHNLFP